MAVSIPSIQVRGLFTGYFQAAAYPVPGSQSLQFRSEVCSEGGVVLARIRSIDVSIPSIQVRGLFIIHEMSLDSEPVVSIPSIQVRGLFTAPTETIVDVPQSLNPFNSGQRFVLLELMQHFKSFTLCLNPFNSGQRFVPSAWNASTSENRTTKVSIPSIQVRGLFDYF